MPKARRAVALLMLIAWSLTTSVVRAGDDFGVVRSEALTYASTVEVSPGTIDFTIDRFDTRNGARRLIDVRIDLEYEVSNMLMYENLSPLPLNNGFYTFSSQVQFLSAIANRITPLGLLSGSFMLSATDGMPGGGADYIDGGLIFQRRIDSFTIASFFLEFLELNNLPVTLFATVDFGITLSGAAAFAVSDQYADAVVTVTYTYLDTLVQPFTTTQVVSYAGQLDDAVGVMLQPFDDVNGSRELEGVTFDHTFGVVPHITLAHFGPDVSDLLGVRNEGTVTLVLPGDDIDVPFLIDQTHATGGIFDIATPDLPDFETTIVLDVPAGLPLTDAFPGEVVIPAILVIDHRTTITGSDDVEIIQNMSDAVGTVNVTYVWSRQSPPLAPPAVQPLFEDRPVQQIAANVNAKGASPCSATGIDDVILAVDRDAAGVPDEVFVFVNTTHSSVRAFAPAGRPLAIGMTPTALTTADLNDDGAMDIVVVTAEDDTMWVIFNDGSGAGTFFDPIGIELDAIDQPVALACGRFNGDDLPDIAVAGLGRRLRLYLNNTDNPGALTPGAVVDIDEPVQLCAVPGDPGWRSDHLALFSIRDQRITMFDMVDETPTPTAVVTISAAARSMTIVDLNGDERSDLVVTNDDAATFTVMPKNEQRTFDAPFTVDVAQATPRQILAGDYDGDGDEDLMLVTDTPGGERRVVFHETDLQDGRTVLRPAVEIAILPADTAVFEGHFDGDEASDIAYIIPITDGVVSSAIGVSLSAPPVLTCPGDCTPEGGNGIVNIDDLFAVLNAMGRRGTCDAAPRNDDGTVGNGIVNVDDLLAVLLAFGPCPE